MRTRCRIVLLFTATISLVAVRAYSQDAPSLGDVARQQRQHKDQTKIATGKDAKTAKVITNEQIPESAEVIPTTEKNEEHAALSVSSEEPKHPDHWKSQILAQKNQIASLQRQVEELNESIHFAPANCAANCVAWNERQREKQQQADRMGTQLQELKKHLDEMQDSARRQGYGSSVYDP